MGATTSEDSKQDNGRLIPLPPVELYHFGQVKRFYDQVTCREVIQAVYEFVLEPDGQDYFINQLKSNNNRCPHLVSIVKIVSEAAGFCNRGSMYHVYFQYLPITLSSILKQQQQPLPEEEVRLLVMSLFDAVMRINQRETQHGDIYPEFIYLDDRGTKKYKIFDSAYFNPLKHGSIILTQVPQHLLRYNYSHTGYYRAFEEESYCSPQVLANLSQRKSFPCYNHCISDTFSIGMVALYTMTLINPTIAYKPTSRQIDYYYIEMLLRIAVQNGYSATLLKCIGQCVQLKNRPSVDEILKCYPEFRFENPCSLKLSLRKMVNEQ